MKNEINRVGKQTIVMINGQMDTLRAKEFERNIRPWLQYERPEVCIDCSELQYVNSNGMRVFMTLLKYVRGMGGKLFFTKMQPEVKYIFDMTGFLTFVNKGK